MLMSCIQVSRKWAASWSAFLGESASTLPRNLHDESVNGEQDGTDNRIIVPHLPVHLVRPVTGQLR